MSIYKTLLQHASQGRNFRINLNSKDLWIGKKQYIKEGEMIVIDDELIDKEDLQEFGIEDLSIKTWEVIEYLYQMYKHSVPNSHWRDNAYFEALSYDELTTDELAYNIDRKYAQSIIEGYILLGSMAKLIEWQNEENWFWQSSEDENLIVLKEWFN